MDKFAMDDIDFGLLAGDGIATRPVKAGAVIFREGDKADGLFIIKSGQVGIRLGNRTLAELTVNNIFGEMALIDDAPRSATAVALERVGVELNRRGFPKLAKHDSSLWPGGGRQGWRMERLFGFG
jgi:CRP-like cAMP-binding protein